MLSQDQLKEWLHYEPSTGVFTRLKSAGNSAAGSIAGYIDDTGYWQIGICGEYQRAHRLAWLYMTGEWPTGDIDHKDRDRANCRWDNLRVVTRRQNALNCSTYSTNTSGIKGVWWHEKRKKWVATANPVAGKQIMLGRFSSLDQAVAARNAAMAHINGG